MPTLSRWFIKAGLVYIVLGLLMATLVIAQPVLSLPPQLMSFRPVYLHLLMVGWITQLIMGVAYWMFPKYSKESPRGSERLGWLIIILLNIGLINEPSANHSPCCNPNQVWAGCWWFLPFASLLPGGCSLPHLAAVKECAEVPKPVCG
jgi:hypothetical protein